MHARVHVCAWTRVGVGVPQGWRGGGGGHASGAVQFECRSDCSVEQ